MTWLERNRGVLVAALLAAILGLAPSQFARAARPQDQLLLVSTRSLGTRCTPSIMADGLQCRELRANNSGQRQWQNVAWREIAERATPTVFYVHGNRVDLARAHAEGMAVYNALIHRSPDETPIRFVIWSWPSEQIRRPVRDYKVKAARTRPAGWQMAWALADLPAETPIAIIGYSYGARLTTGALHVLAGGKLGDLALPRQHRSGATRRKIDVALVAAAVDAAWVRPGGFHGRALEMTDELVLANNRRDPAMRFYHLTFGRHVQPLGYSGLVAGRPRGQLYSIDLTDEVGRSHALAAYLRTCGSLRRIWPEDEDAAEVAHVSAASSTDATGPRDQTRRE